MKMTFEELIEAKHIAHFRREDKMLGKIEKLENKAEQMVGELMREGQTVYYIWPAGGKYREGSRTDLISFLIRNKYV